MPAWNSFTEARLIAITRRLRRRRVDLFVKTLGLGPQHRILDLGSEDGSYVGSVYPFPRSVILADIDEEPMRRGVERHGLGGYRVIPQDGPLPFGEREFDAVWCNSVIEHVTLPRDELSAVRDREFRQRADVHQRRFAAEIARVGSAYFVQTPFVHFPLESHSWLPFVQYVSHERRCRWSRRLQRVWVKQWSADFHLYNRARFKEHFPDADAFLTERVWGIPKSLIAVRRRQ